METIKDSQSIEIYPPKEPLAYPLTTAQVSKIFDVHKSTLFRWEKEKHIPSPKRSISGFQEAREYTEEHLLAIIGLMQQRVKSSLRQLAATGNLGSMDTTGPSWGWLELLKVNPEKITKETTISLPTGYTLHFNPIQK